ncbi:hypothetical protein KD050_08320 [Psychrobacillus sp. INOP01]|uniref:hypothetical protein n=1 Tax=Psychrobacillus sp. INOP01 TaxID=2829187 RepID=UPI001BA6569E|nr:hypothetical protein [Psychrobacillus sp. INOP01]QUG43210.1 hypothetical protein KD050_08320 [Psychrobacillus sp. INOP01]
MKRNWIFGLLIAAVSISALVFIIKGNINMAVLFMTAIFALSNGFRAMSFKEKGFVKEAKWMKGMSILFAVLFFVVLFLLFF